VQAGELGDPLEAAERRDLAEHPVAVRLRITREVLRETPRLAEGVLGGRRVERAGSLRVRHGRAVAESPDVVQADHPQRRVHDDAPALVEWQPELREERVGSHARGPHERPCRDVRAVGEHGSDAVVGLEGGADVDLDAALREPARGVFTEPPGDLREDLRCGIDEHPALGQVS
jgi:hypothetical protein